MTKVDGNYNLKASPKMADRLWGWDSEGNVNATFEHQKIYDLFKSALGNDALFTALTARLDALELKTKAYKTADGVANPAWAKIWETPALTGINHYTFQILYSSGQPGATADFYNGRLTVHIAADATGLLTPDLVKVKMYDDGITDGHIVLQQDENYVVSLWIRRPNSNQRVEFTVPKVGGATNRTWFIDNAIWVAEPLPTPSAPGAEYLGVKAVL